MLMFRSKRDEIQIVIRDLPVTYNSLAFEAAL
jgi:hypothetical protein